MSSVNAPQNALPIDDAQLAQYAAEANARMRKASAVVTLPRTQSTERSGLIDPASFAPITPTTESVSLVELGQKVSRDELLPAEGVFRTLEALRKGYEIGRYVSDQYTKMSGLDTLQQKNKNAPGLQGVEKDELLKKTESASSIALFCASYYVAWALARFRPEDMVSLQLATPTVPVIPTSAPQVSLNHLILWIGKRLSLEDVNNDLAFAKATQQLAKQITDQTALREASLRYLEPFTKTTYKLVNTEFSVSGFSAIITPGVSMIEFKRVQFDEIVGNRDAKHYGRRQAERLSCYDPVRKDNPWRKLGGLSKIAMGYGPPGTGKSMYIAAVATLLEEMCEFAGLPFRFHPLPDAIVSTFQGGSAERAVDWFKPIGDPNTITYAPIDDGENVLEDRTRQGVSAGVREVIGVFLRQTEGAYAIDIGNSAIHIFTNIPDQIDPAVLSRVLERFHIGGAQTPEDFLDQTYLWWRKYTEIDPKFVDLKPPKSYQRLAQQRALTNLGAFYESYTEPKEDAVRELVRKADEKAADRGGEDWFAALYVAAQHAYPTFTSREVRNISSAVSGRTMDFDLPDLWLKNPETFFKQPFERKEAMIIEAMQQNMKGLSFGQIWFQEAIRYLDSFVGIIDVGFERRVKEALNQAHVMQEASKRLREDS